MDETLSDRMTSFLEELRLIQALEKKKYFGHEPVNDGTLKTAALTTPSLVGNMPAAKLKNSQQLATSAPKAIQGGEGPSLKSFLPKIPGSPKMMPSPIGNRHA